MAFWNKKTIKETPGLTIDYKPSMYFGNALINKLTEQFKGETENNKVRFPDQLGEEHPFDFKQLETLYKKFGFFAAVVDKYVDFIWGPGFYIDCKDDRAKEIIENFIRDTNFDSLGRQWTKEALIKGNGFIEIGGSKKEGVKGLKILNANNMFVVRDNKGKITGYNQYTGAFKNFDYKKAISQKKVIPFEADEIAHVPFNIIGDCAYGLGIGVTAMKLIDNYLSGDKSIHTLMERKANAPLHAKFGYINGDTQIVPKAEDVAAFGADLETMSNKTEWTTDPLVEFKVVDFGRFDQKIATVLENDMEMLIYAFQIPAVLLGKANIPEGLARVQLEAFQRRIQSIQTELEKIIEEKIFKRVLNANGLDVHVEFEWGTSSIMETESRMKLISDLMKSPSISGAMNMMLENEMINLLDLDKDDWEKLKLEQEQKMEEERKRLEAQPQPMVPGQNSKFPQPAQPKKEQPKQPKPQEVIIKIDTQEKKENLVSEPIKEKHYNKKIRINNNYEYDKPCPHCDEAFENITDVEEWLGFNYKKYLAEIISYLSGYDFEQIKAITESELQAGYLSDEQIQKLKGILETGFTKGQSLKEMAKEVDKELKLKDLYRMTDDGQIKIGASGLPILAKSSDKRSIGIVRSEVTRMANRGAIEYYKKNEIQKVRWVASYGARTCPLCEDLNGQIFEMTSVPEIPAHSMCRCTIAPVTEVI